MSTENYTREALVKDLINAISLAEKRGIGLGANNGGVGSDRSYIAEVADQAIDIVNRLNIRTS